VRRGAAGVPAPRGSASLSGLSGEVAP